MDELVFIGVDEYVNEIWYICMLCCVFYCVGSSA